MRSVRANETSITVNRYIASRMFGLLLLAKGARSRLLTRTYRSFKSPRKEAFGPFDDRPNFAVPRQSIHHALLKQRPGRAAGSVSRLPALSSSSPPPFHSSFPSPCWIMDETSFPLSPIFTYFSMFVRCSSTLRSARRRVGQARHGLAQSCTALTFVYSSTSSLLRALSGVHHKKRVARVKLGRGHRTGRRSLTAGHKSS